MTEEEYKNLKEGDSVWLFNIYISVQGNVGFKVAAELETVIGAAGETEFRVVKVLSSRFLKVGETVKIKDRWSLFNISSLYINKEEGLEYWNSRIQNGIDKATSLYEKKMKKLKNSLIK